MVTDKIKSALLFSSNLDRVTRSLDLVDNIRSNTDTTQMETATMDAINSLSAISKQFNIDADFVNIDIPTNNRIDNDELVKIKNASVFTTGITDDEKTENLSLVNNIFNAVTANLVPADLSNHGFVGFKVESGGFSETGFDTLNFEANSGFQVSRSGADRTIVDIDHNALSSISVDGFGGNTVDATFSDTLYLVGDGIKLETSVDELNRKFLKLTNLHQSVSSLEDVTLSSTIQNDDILMRKDNKFENIPSQNVRPSIIYGGEF